MSGMIAMHGFERAASDFRPPPLSARQGKRRVGQPAQSIIDWVKAHHTQVEIAGMSRPLLKMGGRRCSP